MLRVLLSCRKIAFGAAVIGVCCAASACSKSARPAQLFFDVDYSACPAASCIDSAQLSIGRDGCLLTRYEPTAASGAPVVGAASVRDGDDLSIALVLHCGAEKCAHCVATRANVTARDQQRVTLQPRPPSACVERGRVPAGVAGLGSCAQTDSGPPRDSDLDATADTTADTTVDGPRPDSMPPAPDAGATLSCGEVISCALSPGCNDLPCQLACQTKACAKAQAAVKNLVDCAVSLCGGTSCLVDLPTCLACVTSNCAALYSACQSNRCT